MNSGGPPALTSTEGMGRMNWVNPIKTGSTTSRVYIFSKVNVFNIYTCNINPHYFYMSNICVQQKRNNAGQSEALGRFSSNLSFCILPSLFRCEDGWRAQQGGLGFIPLVISQT